MAKSGPRFFCVLFLNDLSGLYNCVMISVEVAEPTAVSHLLALAVLVLIPANLLFLVVQSAYANGANTNNPLVL